MITKVKYGLFASGAMPSNLSPRQLERLNGILKKIAAAYDDDPGVSDLDDEQPAHFSNRSKSWRRATSADAYTLIQPA